jgi:hypothetical protein
VASGLTDGTVRTPMANGPLGSGRRDSVSATEVEALVEVVAVASARAMTPAKGDRTRLVASGAAKATSMANFESVSSRAAQPHADVLGPGAELGHEVADHDQAEVTVTEDPERPRDEAHRVTPRDSLTATAIVVATRSDTGPDRWERRGDRGDIGPKVPKAEGQGSWRRRSRERRSDRFTRSEEVEARHPSPPLSTAPGGPSAIRPATMRFV